MAHLSLSLRGSRGALGNARARSPEDSVAVVNKGGFIALLLLVSLVFSDHGSGEEPLIAFDIPASPAHRGLNLFARQADIQILYPFDEVKDLRVDALRGEYSLEAGLEKLVAGICLKPGAHTDRGLTLNIIDNNQRFWLMKRNIDDCKSKGVFSALSVALASVFTASPALAQEETRAQQRGGGIEEVLVTAQRRSERIEDVPISINAFDQGALDRLRILSTDQLQFATPGIVNTSTSGDGISAIYIRGVGTGYSGPGLEGSVAVYLDDVYLQTQTSSAQAAIDVSQIQVLKGPQGTLYGRNATGGAVIIETNDPQLDDMDGYVQLGYGRLNWKRAEGVLNAPVAPTLALRFAGFHEERDGYVRNIAHPDQNKSGVGAGTTYMARVKGLWEPSDRFRSVATVGYDRRNGNGAIHSLRYGPDGTPTELGFFETMQAPFREGGGGDDTDGAIASLRIDYQFDDVWSLTNTLAYRRTRAYGCTDNDGTPVELLYFCTVSGRSPDSGSADGKVDKTLTNEMRITSDSGGPLDVTAGLFLTRNKARFVGRIGGAFFGDLTPTFDNRNELTAYSAYFDLSYQLSERLRLLGGLRYTQEDKKHSVLLDQDALDFVGGTLPQSDRDKTDFNNISPRLVLSYDAGIANYYVSYSRGFKSGGFNSPAFAIDPPLNPEKIEAYEVGAKFRSDDGRLGLSAATFYYDWKDVQVAFITGGGAGIMQQNAAGARSYGAEVNLDWSPDPDWRFDAGLAYTHARFTRFPQAAVYNLNGGFLSATAEDLKGRRLPHAPDITANASITHFFDLPSGWSGDITLAVRHTSKYDFTAGAGGELRASQQKSFTLVNLTGGFAPAGSRYELGLFGANLLGEKYIQLVSTGDTGVYMTPAEPRTYGATLRFNF